MTFKYNKADEELRKFDAYAHAVTTIDELHRMTHDGFVFHTSGKVTGMVDANVDDFLIVTDALNFPHFQRLRFTVSRGDFDIQTYEKVAASDNGSELTAVFNTNRNSSNTPAMKLYTAPTITDLGTLAHTAWLPPTAAGQGNKGNAGLTGETNGEEWILEPATKYLVRCTNNSGETISYVYEALWYEIGYEK